MQPAEILLEHFDRLAASRRAKFFPISGERPALNVAFYAGAPKIDWSTAFTMGLSHAHSGNAHKELVIRMHDRDESWALAAGFLAMQLRGRCPFTVGDTINFRERIASASPMNAFVVLDPTFLPTSERIVDIGVRRVQIMQVVPIHESERLWLENGGDVVDFIASVGEAELANPERRAVA